MGKQVERDHQPSRAGDVRDSWADVTLAKTLLGWDPQIDLEEGLRRTVESREFAAAGEEIGFTPAFLSADQFGKLIARDDARLGNVMADLGLRKR